MRRTVIVNGIKTHGEGNVDKFKRALTAAQIPTADFWYPRRGIITGGMRYFVRKDGKALYEGTLDGDHIAAHSRGPLIVNEAMRLGRKFGVVWYYSPAVRIDAVFPPEGAEEIYIVFNPTDDVINLTWLLRWLMPWSMFGAMGSHGAEVQLQSIPTHNIRHYTEIEGRNDHIAPYFEGENLETWVAAFAESVGVKL